MSAGIIPILILLINCLVIILLVLIFYLLKREREILELTRGKSEEKIIDQTRTKSSSILHQAIRKAQNIITDSQKKGLKVFSAQKLEAKELAKDYLAEMDSSSKSAQKAYQDFIAEVENKIRHNLIGDEKLLEIKAQNFIEAAKKALSQFTSQMEGKVKKEVDDEMLIAKKEIEEYRRKRQKILDEKIVDILQEVLMLTISKKLTLSDQSEFIYKSLAEAKKNHAFQ